MKDKCKIITLCGSTKFKNKFIEIQRKLTLAGSIVISVGLFSHADNEQITTECKKMLDKMHKQKIDMADEIYVINVGGYIGSSTKSEIEYARKMGKIVHFLEKCDFSRECDKNDENMENACWDCNYFCFPIGCMFGKE